MNVVIYARFSSHNQTEQSIEGQLKACQEYANKNDLLVVNTYIDRALSGTTDKREKFLEMIRDSEKKRFEQILVYQLDRFSRNRYDSATYKAKLKKNGVKVVSVRENISDDASGVLMETLLEGMAEYYSVELGQKVRRGLDLNAEKCLSTGGLCALGYKVDQDRHFQINEETAWIVQLIFEMYAKGHTAKDISEHLNMKGLRTVKGAVFRKNSIYGILQNKSYIGVYTYNGKEIAEGMPRIISDELFDMIQGMRRTNKKAPARKRAREEYLLTTKLYCGYDKEMMTGVSGTSKTGDTYNYYSCKNSRKGCKKKNVAKKYIEDLVLRQAREQLTEENIAIIATAVEKEYLKQEGSQMLSSLEKQLDKANQGIENLLSAIERGQDLDVLLERLSQRQAEQKSLEKQIIEEKSQYFTLTALDIRSFLVRLMKGDIDDIASKKALLAVFIHRVYLYDDKMTIVFTVGDVPTNVDMILEDQGIIDNCAKIRPEKSKKRGSSIACLASPRLASP